MQVHFKLFSMISPKVSAFIFLWKCFLANSANKQLLWFTALTFTFYSFVSVSFSFSLCFLCAGHERWGDCFEADVIILKLIWETRKNKIKPYHRVSLPSCWDTAREDQYPCWSVFVSSFVSEVKHEFSSSCQLLTTRLLWVFGKIWRKNLSIIHLYHLISNL